MRIFLVGFMASGKSSVARRLARRLGFTYVDTDRLVEQDAGMGIARIFEMEGEAAFRIREQKALGKTLEMEQVVVATGGGLPCVGDNMQRMLGSGRVVYLCMAPESLVYRLEYSRKRRPLADGLKGEALLNMVNERLAVREPYYKQAHCIIRGESLRLSQLLNLLFGEESLPGQFRIGSDG